MEDPIIEKAAVRPARATDAASIAGILRALGWFDHLAAETPDETESRLRCHIGLCKSDNSHSLYVAESGNQILGYAAVHWLPYLFLTGPEGYLSELFVAETHRGKGVGRKLLKTITTEARNRGCSRLMLVTSRSRESYKRKFYSKHEWIEREGVANFILKL